MSCFQDYITLKETVYCYKSHSEQLARYRITLIKAHLLKYVNCALKSHCP